MSRVRAPSPAPLNSSRDPRGTSERAVEWVIVTVRPDGSGLGKQRSIQHRPQLMLSSAGVTSRLDRLERRGFVQRLPDPDDRRGVIVELTDAGVEIVDAAVEANTVSDRQLTALFDPQE